LQKQLGYSPAETTQIYADPGMMTSCFMKWVLLRERRLDYAHMHTFVPAACAKGPEKREVQKKGVTCTRDNGMAETLAGNGLCDRVTFQN